MSLITSPVLKRLGDLYGLRGGETGPGHLEVAAGAPCVANVQRFAERCSGLGAFHGFASIETQQNHVGAGSLTVVPDIWVQLRAQIPALTTVLDGAYHWCWYLSSFTQTTTALISVVNHYLTRAASFGGGNDLLFRSTASSDPTNLGMVPALPWPPYPLIVPEGSLLTYFSTATGAGIAVHKAMFWVGPIGAPPPMVS